MQYVLQNWDNLISRTLHPDNLHLFAFNGDSIQGFIDQYEAEKEHLRSQMIADIFSLDREKKVALYIQGHQAVLVTLLDKLYDYQKTAGISEEIQQLYGAISDDLDYILDFIEQYFPKYLRTNEKLPRLYLDRARHELGRKVKELEQFFKGRAGAEGELHQMVLAGYQRFLADDTVQYTYRDPAYYRELMNELLNLERQPVEDGYSALERVLISNNFNSPAFTNYLINQIMTKVNQVAGKEQKMHLLALNCLKISLIPVKSTSALNPAFAGVQTGILHILEKEMQYFQSIALSFFGNLSAGLLPPKQSEPESYVSIPYNGVEAYLFLRSLLDAGGITNHNYSSLLELVAPYIYTRQQKGFSSSSMLKYSDKIDTQSRDAVRRLLQKMIRNIDSY